MRIKEEYCRCFAIAKQEYDDATEADKESGIATKPVGMQMRTNIGREFWFLETEEFREEIAQEAEDAHNKEMEEWEQARAVPKTAQQFHQ